MSLPETHPETTAPAAHTSFYFQQFTCCVYNITENHFNEYAHKSSKINDGMSIH